MAVRVQPLPGWEVSRDLHRLALPNRGGGRPITGEPDAHLSTGIPTPRDPSRGGPGVPHGAWPAVLRVGDTAVSMGGWATTRPPKVWKPPRRGSSSRFPRRTATLVVGLSAIGATFNHAGRSPGEGVGSPEKSAPVRWWGTRAG